MKIFVLDTSSKAASAAVWEDGHLLADCWQNTGRTHSVTSLPMAESLLDGCSRTLEEMDALAVTAGPGSFTGLRIGISTVKGLAWGLEKPCAGVSTLEAMAWNLAHMDGVICCAMDARRRQVYNALFRARGGALERLCEDRAISLEELARELEGCPDAQIVVGDGAQLCYNDAEARGYALQMAPPHLRFQSAWGVARAALECVRRDELVSGAALEAHYLRLSQAERERLAKEKENRG